MPEEEGDEVQGDEAEETSGGPLQDGKALGDEVQDSEEVEGDEGGDEPAEEPIMNDDSAEEIFEQMVQEILKEEEENPEADEVAVYDTMRNEDLSAPSGSVWCTAEGEEQERLIGAVLGSGGAGDLGDGGAADYPAYDPSLSPEEMFEEATGRGGGGSGGDGDGGEPYEGDGLPD